MNIKNLTLPRGAGWLVYCLSVLNGFFQQINRLQMIDGLHIFLEGKYLGSLACGVNLSFLYVIKSSEITNHECGGDHITWWGKQAGPRFCQRTSIHLVEYLLFQFHTTHESRVPVLTPQWSWLRLANYLCEVKIAFQPECHIYKQDRWANACLTVHAPIVAACANCDNGLCKLCMCFVYIIMSLTSFKNYPNTPEVKSVRNHFESCSPPAHFKSFPGDYPPQWRLGQSHSPIYAMYLLSLGYSYLLLWQLGYSKSEHKKKTQQLKLTLKTN